MRVDELSKQKMALKILGRCFAFRAGKDTLSYLYQEYDVSFKLYYTVVNNYIYGDNNFIGECKYGNDFG